MSTHTPPSTAPHQVADDTWLIPRIEPAGPEGYVFLNSLVIRGEQPVLVDTGAAVHRERWMEDVFTLVEPGDVRWVFISHADADHAGNLPVVLERCPNATVITDFVGLMKLGILYGLPPHRACWLTPGESLDAGDRQLTAVLPPLFDSGCTRALFDSRSGVLWATDAFAGPTPGAVYEASELPYEMWRASFRPFNSMENPWHSWLDRDAYCRHLDALGRLPRQAIASCHGPVLRGQMIQDAMQLVRDMAGQPLEPPPPPQLLESIVAAALAHAEGRQLQPAPSA
jgi:flavorubredoxin